MTRALITQMLGALRNAVPCDSKQADEQLYAITAAREYLATEQLSKAFDAAVEIVGELRVAKSLAVTTGWDNGLSQDYCKELGQWLASRPGARQQVKEMFEADAQQAVPSGERAELIQWLRRAHEVFGNKNSKTIADMLEADAAFRPDWVNYRQGVKDGKAEAQQAKQVPMSSKEIYQLAQRGAMNNGLSAIVREVEAHHGITPK